MDIRLSMDKQVEIAKIQALRRSVGWAERSTEQWQRILERSTHVVTAWDGELLVGMGRILDDGVMAMFYDLAVAPAYQAKGVGFRLGRALIDCVKDAGFTQIGLFAANDSRLIRAYERMGWVRSATAMELAPYQQVPVVPLEKE